MVQWRIQELRRGSRQHENDGGFEVFDHGLKGQMGADAEAWITTAHGDEQHRGNERGRAGHLVEVGPGEEPEHLQR